MRCCWVHEVSPLPLVFTGERPPACGAGECGNANCPRRRPAPPQERGAGDLDGMLGRLGMLAADPPDTDELTERVMSRLRAEGALPSELAELGDRA